MPEHWELLRLKDLSPRISGRLVYQPAQYFSEEGVPFLMGNNVTPDGIRWEGVKRIPPAVNERFAHHALREGDVVTVRVGAPGVTCVVPQEADGLNCGSLMIIRRSPRFDSHWLAYAMNSEMIKTQIAFVQYGAAQEQINIEDATNFRLPVPPLVEQSRIVQEIATETGPLDTLVRHHESSISRMQEYRTRLVADVVTGKIDVRQASADLPDASTTAEDEGLLAEAAAESDLADLDDAEAEVIT
jgi:type I restriction enzyme, S subunit